MESVTWKSVMRWLLPDSITVVWECLHWLWGSIFWHLLNQDIIYIYSLVFKNTVLLVKDLEVAWKLLLFERYLVPQSLYTCLENISFWSFQFCSILIYAMVAGANVLATIIRTMYKWCRWFLQFGSAVVNFFNLLSIYKSSVILSSGKSV